MATRSNSPRLHVSDTPVNCPWLKITIPDRNNGSTALPTPNRSQINNLRGIWGGNLGAQLNKPDVGDKTKPIVLLRLDDTKISPFGNSNLVSDFPPPPCPGYAVASDIRISIFAGGFRFPLSRHGGPQAAFRNSSLPAFLPIIRVRYPDGLAVASHLSRRSLGVGGSEPPVAP